MSDADRSERGAGAGDGDEGDEDDGADGDGADAVGEPSDEPAAGTPPVGGRAAGAPADLTRDELVARVAELRAANRRLRDEYAAARRSRHRRAAAGLYLVGGLAVGAAVVFPSARGVLFALGATGLFAGILTYYLTPERFVAERVGEHVATAGGATLRSLVEDLGLRETFVYFVPGDGGRDRWETDVSLFVPETDAYVLPTDDPRPGIHAGEPAAARGLVVVPVGGLLLREFERGLSGPLADDPARLADQVTDGLTDGFEIAERVEHEVAAVGDGSTDDVPDDADDEAADDAAVGDADPDAPSGGSPDRGRITLTCEGAAFGPTTRIDHPVPSFVAAAAARGLGTPVELTVDRPAGDGARSRITVEWGGVSGR